MKNNFTKEEKEILKNALKDYEEIEQVVNFLIKNIKDIDLKYLYDILKDIFSFGLCNYEENEFLDFYYKDLLLTISNYGKDNTLIFSNDIDVYFGASIDSIHFNNKNELREVIENEF